MIDSINRLLLDGHRLRALGPLSYAPGGLTDRFQGFDDCPSECPQAGVCRNSRKPIPAPPRTPPQGVRLASNWREMLYDLAALGPVEAVTRNAYAVHRAYGAYPDRQYLDGALLRFGRQGGLRLDLSRWHSGLIGADPSCPDGRLCARFLDGSGTVLHTVYPTDESDLDALDSLITVYRSAAEVASLDGELESLFHYVDWIAGSIGHACVHTGIRWPATRI